MEAVQLTFQSRVLYEIVFIKLLECKGAMTYLRQYRLQLASKWRIYY